MILDDTVMVKYDFLQIALFAPEMLTHVKWLAYSLQNLCSSRPIPSGIRRPRSCSNVRTRHIRCKYPSPW